MKDVIIVMKCAVEDEEVYYTNLMKKLHYHADDIYGLASKQKV